MKKSMIALGLPLLAVAAFVLQGLGGQEKKDPQEKDVMKAWMRKKLDFSKNVLEGLAKGDFDKISENAQDLNAASYLQKWTHADKPDYKAQLTMFDFANRELFRQAKEKNISGATLAYNQLIVSCVHCHQVVRGGEK